MQPVLKTNRHFVGRVVFPVVAFAVAAILLAMLGLFWSTWQSDRLSVEREIGAVQFAIDRSIQELAREQEMVAIGDQAFLELREPAPDPQWLDMNIGRRLTESFDHDRVFILGGDDKPVYAFLNGARADPALFEALRADVAEMLDVVRGRVPESNHRHDRNPSQARPDEDGVLTTEQAVHTSHLTSIQGNPAAVSIMKMRPLSEAHREQTGTEPLLISIRSLDTEFLRSLSTAGLIHSPRFSNTGELSEGERAIILKGDRGEALGNFIWTPEHPGSEIFKIIGPVTAMVLLVMFALLAWLTRSLLRAFSHLRLEVRVREEAEMRADALARHDSLTGLPIRRVFVEELDKLLGEPSEASCRWGALLMVDVDSMRRVNDAHGFDAADELLVQLALRLKGAAGEKALVARTGSDEFSVLVWGNDEEGSARTAAEDLWAALRTRFRINGAEVSVGVTGGAALFPKHAAKSADLINAADAALARAKRDARASCTFYDPDRDVSGRLAANVRELGGDISRRKGFEVSEVTDTFVRSTCRSALEWPAETSLCLAVPAAQLNDPWFAARLLAVVNSTGFPTSRLIVEVPEAAMNQNLNACGGNLKELRAAGVRVSVSGVGRIVGDADQVRIQGLETALAHRAAK